MRDCADLLAPSLTKIFNASLRSTPALKLAYVRPLFKSGDPFLPANYCPVSILPKISKLLEKVVQKQLTTFLSKTNALLVSQFAFRQGHSTEDAL